MNKENVYIIIPVHNRKDITLKCLETLKDNGDLAKYYAIVVDDSSTDGTSEAIKSLYPEVIILEGDGNLWWTGAIKKGMEYAYKKGAEYFIWLNDDCLVAKESINNLIVFCKQNINTIIGYQGYQSTNHQQIAFGGHRKNKQIFQYPNKPLFESINCPQNKIEECDMLNGNFVCLPRSVVDTTGYPKSNLYPHYLGDFIYLTQVQNQRFKIYVSNQYLILNTLSEFSRLNPQNWLIQEGKTLDIIKLMFTPQSLLSWRVWLAYHLTEYSYFKGFISFINYYGWQYFVPIVFITFLRFFPQSFRLRVSEFKRRFTTYF